MSVPLQRPAHAAGDRQRGFGLVESLVALVVVSVGMIGIAALFGHGLGASRTALFRTQAVNLASDMADRIRLNRQGAAAYNAAAADSDCEPAVTACTPAEMAAHDLRVWNDAIERELPGGAAAFGTVAYVPAVPPTYTIKVNWRETGVLAAGSHEVAIHVADR